VTHGSVLQVCFKPALLCVKY